MLKLVIRDTFSACSVCTKAEGVTCLTVGLIQCRPLCVPQVLPVEVQLMVKLCWSLLVDCVVTNSPLDILNLVPDLT